MSQEVTLQFEPSYTLKSLELYNWGGFDGANHAVIDPMGTAVIGPTGSGKTTLVDALMTLLCANPKYNLASTGGHESDRDLVSYVRGVAAAGDGSGSLSQTMRRGKTVTGIAATLDNGNSIARLGAIFWFDDTSSSVSDLKRVWFFTTAAEQTLQQWINLHYEGGKRALRQLEKTATGIWTYPSKKTYLARIRDFFEVRENAFNLLNRAAGLKQLNSIDDIFRELVLDDTSQFKRAEEVSNSFDDLTAIHEELEIARRQQRSLEPVAATWEKFKSTKITLDEKIQLKSLLPIWFGEQAYQLWKAELERLNIENEKSIAELQSIEETCKNKQDIRDNLKASYLQLGGSDIQILEESIEVIKEKLLLRQKNAADYQLLTQKLALPDTLDRALFLENKNIAKQRLHQAEVQHKAAEEKMHAEGSIRYQSQQQLKTLKAELAEAKQRPSSNIQIEYQVFRSTLAAELNLTEEELPFVAELIQVKENEMAWRGAIERAIGSHRLRILVPSLSAKQALKWINQRHNNLHVRILEARQAAKSTEFWEDGFTRKLAFKKHAYREIIKEFLSGIDRHCVESIENLQHTPYAMTQQGLMSGKTGFFDKQDKKRLDQNWLTGFDNKDRLNFLQQEINKAENEFSEINAKYENYKTNVNIIDQEKILLKRLSELNFEEINSHHTEQQLTINQEKLLQLSSPNSDISTAKSKYQQAEKTLKEYNFQRDECIKLSNTLINQLKEAENQKSKAFKQAEIGLTEEQRGIAKNYFPAVQNEQIYEIPDIEKQALEKIIGELDSLNKQCAKLENDLGKLMSDAKKEDRGALAEVGRELQDIPEYLQRLKLLNEEALPEKRQRFTDYLNRSSDEGVTQLLSTIESEVERIEEKLEDLNNTLRRVDFQAKQYMQLVSSKVSHESLRTFNKARTNLVSANFDEDDGESQYKALQKIIILLRDACERKRLLASKALLDPRFRLEFKVSVIDRTTGNVVNKFSGSQSRSGGEKEIIASYVLTASLSYALCPDGSSHPLFGTIVLDEAFSRSSHAVASRIIAALKEFGLHALFITPNKEMRLLRKHTRSAIVVHRRGTESSLTPLSWEELDDINAQRKVSS